MVFPSLHSLKNIFRSYHGSDSYEFSLSRMRQIGVIPEIRNIYFLIDYYFLKNVLEIVIDDEDRRNRILGDALLMMASGSFSRDHYLELRLISFSSGFSFNKLLRKFYVDRFSSYEPVDERGVQIFNNLTSYGYHVIPPSAQSIAFCKDVNLLFDQAILVREKDGIHGTLKDLLSENVSGGFRFNAKEEELPTIAALRLIREAGILAAISSYLGSPILRQVESWASVRPNGFNDQDIISAAQKFHFDLDNPAGWVKVFIYLNDVDALNGPHVYAPKSHLALPINLRRDGRFDDDEVNKAFGSNG